MSSNHKTLNGNLNLVATAAQQQQQQQQQKISTTTTTTNVNNLMKINSNNNNNNIGDKITQQHQKQIAPNPISKLQQQQQQQHHQQQQQQQQQFQQRRSLLPAITTSTAHQHHLTQQQSVTSAAAAASSTTTTAATGNNNNGAQSHQLQTVATIHQQHSQQQQQQQHQSAISRNTTGAAAAAAAATSSSTSTSAIPTITGSATTSATTTTTAAATATTGEPHINGNVSVPPHTRRSLYQLQALRSAHNLKAPAHSIPPRYQPPPQPQGGGILKTPANSKRHTAYYTDQLQLKYPPDIPQLSAVYIPDSVKAQQQQQQQQQAHRYLPTTHRQSQVDMLKFVRKPEQDHPSPNASVTSSTTGIPTVNGGGSNVGSGSVNGAGRLTAEQNRQLQSLVNELRALKEQNQRLLDDNQELRDLCCFLDDDRQKGRKLAREWQRFGRYTASVMRQEVAAYQNKLRQLDDKQQELITDNLELKELCLYLDEERAHVAANALCAGCGTATRNALRDDGDGSSSSTNADETMTALRNYERQLPDLQLRNASLNDQTLQYVRSLERRIQQLEEERVTTTPTAQLLQQQQQQQQQQQLSTQQQLPPPPPPAPQLKLTQQQTQQHHQQQQQQTLTDATLGGEPIAGRPEAVVRALQVLEVREQLERDRLGNHILHHHTTPHHHIHHQQHQQQHNHLTGNSNSSALDQMDDGEKALVREMCNVVWRKLEGSPGNGGPATLEPL